MELLGKLVLMTISIITFRCRLGKTEYLEEFEILEGLGIGTTIGFIGQNRPGMPPYLIVPVPGSAVDSDLEIDQSTGEIRSSIVLDREVRSYYSFVAIPLSGENIRVEIKVLDANDNAPTFPTPFMCIEFPENSPRDMKRTLNAARDKDLGIFNTRGYEIVSGNKNNAFRLSSHREIDDVLYLDLQINGFLDRETTPFYSLLIEAYDGGTPPLKGTMRVNITIQDANDNEPIFNQSRYFATIAENATIGSSVLRVYATDTDLDENGRITYSINRRQSDRENKFTIDSKLGVISVNKPLDFEAKDVHELVVVARDSGVQPLESTAFVSIRVTDVNDHSPTINLIFLSEDASPKISEDARIGDFVARISVSDPDSKQEYANVNVSLQGGDGHFALTTADNIIYLVIVSHPLDREVKSNYTLIVTATDQGNPPLNTSRTFELCVVDTNDNAPEFGATTFYANVLEVADPGTSVFQLSAVDRDEGNNSIITYSIKDSPETSSHSFEIDSRTGLITTRCHIDCETNPMPRITVVATDKGNPPLSSSVTVVVTISDLNENKPIFDQSFYNVSVAEDESVGACFLKISATDADCGVNAMVNYTLIKLSHDFYLEQNSGDLCIARPLDYETKRFYEIPVLAMDRGGLSTITVVRVHIIDVNDNRPVFMPEEYNVSLPERELITSAVVVVVATDKDSKLFGEVRYEISAGNVGFFRMNEKTGEIFVTETLSTEYIFSPHHLVISAFDGDGLSATVKANVYINVITDEQPPFFTQVFYNFFVEENASSETIVGKVTAVSRDPRAGPVHYVIKGGDPGGFFMIDTLSGTIKSKAKLDHETHSNFLLNIQATSGRPLSSVHGYAQVNISVSDINDNYPLFSSKTLKISVPENIDLNTPIYVVHAEDLDSNRNSQVEYHLLDNPDNAFIIGKSSGQIMPQISFDYEIRKHPFILVIRANDLGNPPLFSNLTFIIDLYDVNDNSPSFIEKEYRVSILESLPVNSEFLHVSATDEDSGNNARLSFKLSSNEEGISKFGVFPNTGFLYLKEALDRELFDEYTLTISVTDHGVPSLSSSTVVYIQVLDTNDNDPQFTMEVFNFAVKENTASGHHIGTLSAYDKDLGNNATLRYFLLNSNGTFDVNAVTGEIFSETIFDREVVPKYELIAEVRDQGTPFRYDRAIINVEILDINDHPPVFFMPQESVIEILEGEPSGTEVSKVIAKDVDQDLNGAIRYEILPGSESTDGADVFSIDSSTGVIRTKQILDYDQQKLYTLTIVAEDKGSPALQSQLKLKINVLDVNGNQPIFPASSFSFKIKEGVSVGTEVGVIQAIDEGGKENRKFLYSIVGGNLYGTFDIVHSTGSIYTIAEVDFEKSAESIYNLQIKAIDNSGVNHYSSVISAKIEIEDINDCAPVFQHDPILFSIPENTSQGKLIWNFSATDLDSGPNGQLKYTISQQSPGVAFQIDEMTGSLFLKETVDYETFQEYFLIVTASDQGDKPLATSVTTKIILEDINENAPIFETTDKITVMENEPINYSILYVIATDKDSKENGRVTYLISNGNEKGYFSLDSDSGLLSLAKELDREEIDYFELNITASDHGRPSLSKSQLFYVHVKDVNDNSPHFKQHIYHANVSEAATKGAFVLKVEALDADFAENGKLSYMIPFGVADNKFTIDKQTGEIHTASLLDREEQASYVVPVYVRDDGVPSRHDLATLKINVVDINDHSPVFSDSCYTLRIPENSGFFRVIHTLVATDSDANLNAAIVYAITDGNTEKFSIDPRTGELSSQSLDREQAAKHTLIISAHDQGEPPLTAVCNITILVIDENDNDPQFEYSDYSATIAEDITMNSTVIIATAYDPDFGVNGEITYSLGNETKSLFSIDSFTGAITTSGLFDREKEAMYVFEVKATDGGRYNARSTTAVVQISIADINDNRPIFSSLPYITSVSAHAAPGTRLIELKAEDSDEGPNGKVFYSFTSPYSDRFHLDSETGIVSVAGSLLADSGHVFHCEIEARDKGQISKVTKGMLEIHVGEGVDHLRDNRLQFQNDTYIVKILENSPVGKEIVQVKAIPSGISTALFYSIKTGNEENTFHIDARTGIVTVRNSAHLDYETTPEIKMLVAAESEKERKGSSPTYVCGYATLTVQLIDENDVSPSFSQNNYVATVWEGNIKGSYVTKVTAFDKDQGNGIIYQITDGNYDHAFIIDPPFSGIVKTHIVLDREIRETYHLTILAIDDGIPQLSGSCTLHVRVIDVNDNQPVFPPQNVVSISEGAEIGSVISTITANDVDTNPALIYSFSDGGNPNDLFNIDRFSGRITLVKPLDHETNSQYLLQIQASDSLNVAETSLVLLVSDKNDNRPTFTQEQYEVTVPELVKPGYEVISLNASDKDSAANAEIRYSIITSAVDGFFIDENTGTIYTNKTLTFDPPTIELIVSAADKGQPPMTSVTVVLIQVKEMNDNSPQFESPSYISHVSEDAARGSTIIKVSATDHDKSYFNYNIVDYKITDGNFGNVFAITNLAGEIILMKSLDREEKESYSLKVFASDRGNPSLNASADVQIIIDDVNDSPPVFNQTLYQAYISELAPIDSSVLQVIAKDKDGLNSKIVYDITSGNDDQKFHINANTGVITIRQRLDYDTVPEYKLILRATDSDPPRFLSALTSVLIKVLDENDNTPRFVIQTYMYNEAIEENSPVGTPIFMAHAIDADRGSYGKLNYSITEGDGKDKFKVDPDTGLISSLVVFDYESRTRFFFTLMAMDTGGKYATVQVQIDIESKDEYPPEFTQNSYHYTIPGDASIGYLVGNVDATDLDDGIDGRIIFSLRSQSNFAINSTTGIITVKSLFHWEGSSRLKREVRNQVLSLFVFASSGRPGSLSSSVVVDILIDYSLNSSHLSATGEKVGSSLPAWGMGLVIALSLLALVLLGMIFFLRKRTKRSSKPTVVQGFDNSFDTIDIHHPPSSSASISQFPPHYSDISNFDPPESSQHVTHTGATSEVSDQSHSASSGRGSAEEGEDVEDEEIRMINEGPLLQHQKLQRIGLPDSGLHRDDDNMSDISVHNTQEYLARLGINTSQSDQRSIQDYSKISNTRSVESMHMFDEEGGESDGMDIGNLIYSKLHDVGTDENEAILDGTRGFGFGDEGEPSMTGSLSSIVHSEEELTGSYNWDYLLDWGPQYQPLAHVFAEIARLKDDSVSSYASSTPKTLNPQVKTVPPPLITNVAPRSIAPVALNSGHTSQVASFPTLPRSPINHESTFSSPAMSPSFSPALSPLATRSPSISPLVSPGGSSANAIQLLGSSAAHMSRTQRSTHTNVASSGSETELQI